MKKLVSPSLFAAAMTVFGLSASTGQAAEQCSVYLDLSTETAVLTNVQTGSMELKQDCIELYFSGVKLEFIGHSVPTRLELTVPDSQAPLIVSRILAHDVSGNKFEVTRHDGQTTISVSNSK